MDLSFLSNLINLEILALSYCEIEDLEAMKGLTKLKEFSIINVPKKNNNKESKYKNS